MIVDAQYKFDSNRDQTIKGLEKRQRKLNRTFPSRCDFSRQRMDRKIFLYGWQTKWKEIS
jgi:hypothetical protein